MAQTTHLDQYSDRQSKPLLRRERLRIPNACQLCRSRKVKCDGSRPACFRCRERGEVCAYNRDSLTAGHGGGKHKAAAGRGTRARRPSKGNEFNSFHSHALKKQPSAPKPLVPEHAIEEQDGALDPNRTYFTPHCRFDGKVKEVVAANDQKAGLTPPPITNLVPFVDAPLFGELELDSLTRSRDFLAHLPPRPHANYLVSIYWRHVDSIEPVLDRGRFFHDYEASYTRSWDVLLTDHEIWLSILNIVFALAVQRQETTPVRERDAEATLYFQRAWVLLRPEKFLWKPGSVQLVQCLMLMNRYLHCTSHQQKTWMTGGLALRISQNMPCQPPNEYSSPDSDTERETRQRVWASCVALEKCVAWSLGRTSVPSMIPLPDMTTQISSVYEDENLRTDLEYSVRGLELHEIGNQIQLAQVQMQNRVASRLGLPRLYQQPEYHTVAVQLDTCLNNWENDLPIDWQFENLQNIADRLFRAKAFLLHARLLHTRITLYRPMLARYFSKQSHSNSTGLSPRLLRECAVMCVETAEKIVTMILDSIESNEAIGLLPWWYRVYYLHIAGITFLAAMLGDLFTESVSQSWNSMLTSLREHVHLSIFIPQCIATFETLSQRILETRNPSVNSGGDSALDDDTAGLCFDDLFKDLDLDFSSFLFGIEDPK